VTPDRAAPRIGITLGDPAGIGPEIVSKILRKGVAGVRIRVYGDVSTLDPGSLPGVELRAIASHPVQPGKPDPRAAHGVIEAIRAATRDCLAGDLAAVVTAPIAKDQWARAGYTYPGHTELLAELCGDAPAVMMLTGGSLRVVPATIHCALREVPERIAALDWASLLDVVHRDLVRSFGLERPRIALCGLNPHAGESGRFGDEEQRVLAPVIRTARERGLDVRGPLPADTIFTRAVSGELDCVIGMYHDQVLGPLKLHAFGRAVNVTLGLPIARTSVDHGTAFDIAGQDRADPGSLAEAIRVAIEMAERRSAAARQP
jgi:4-hydroxythreonine-4-phosphate dehydrogenase